MIEILCDGSTSCKEACDNIDYHRNRQRQTFNMSVKSMRISLDHFIYCILGNVSKRSLITSVTTVHGLDNQKLI